MPLPRAEFQTVTIASGTATSTAVDCTGLTLVAIEQQAAHTNGTLYIQGSVSGVNGTFRDLYTSGGTRISVAVATSGSPQIVNVAPTFTVSGLSAIRLVSGGNEAAARTLTLCFIFNNQ